MLFCMGNHDLSPLGEVWDRAGRLQEKMNTNLGMAKDRLNVLGEISSIDACVLMRLLYCLFNIAFSL